MTEFAHRNSYKDTIIKNMKADVEYMDSKHLDDLEKREYETTCRISEIEQGIADKRKEIARFV